MQLTKSVSLRASGALAIATTEYGISYEDTKTSGTATSTSANKLVNTAGLFTTAGTYGAVAVGDIIKNTTTGAFALVTAVDSATQLSVGTDIFSSTNTYTIYSHHGYNKFHSKFSELVTILDVTAAGTDAGDTLDVYVDTSFDAGATYINIGHFTQVIGTGGAKRFVMAFKANPITASNSVSATADQAASAALQIGFGESIRYRAVEVNSSTVDSTFTFSLSAHFK